MRRLVARWGRCGGTRSGSAADRAARIPLALHRKCSLLRSNSLLTRFLVKLTSAYVERYDIMLLSQTYNL